MDAIARHWQRRPGSKPHPDRDKPKPTEKLALLYWPEHLGPMPAAGRQCLLGSCATPQLVKPEEKSATEFDNRKSAQ